MSRPRFNYSHSFSVFFCCCCASSLSVSLLNKTKKQTNSKTEQKWVHGQVISGADKAELNLNSLTLSSCYTQLSRRQQQKRQKKTNTTLSVVRLAPVEFLSPPLLSPKRRYNKQTNMRRPFVYTPLRICTCVYDYAHGVIRMQVCKCAAPIEQKILFTHD